MDNAETEHQNQRVLILGLGVLGGGVSVARYFGRQGANLRITDTRGEKDLRPALEQLRDIAAEYVLGRHREEDVEWADLIIRNPAVRPDSPILRRAFELGKPVETDLVYFLRRCRNARIIAVTGTKGKTTTSTLLHHLLRPVKGRVYLAGNMGVPVLPLLDRLADGDLVVLEVSSYQLETITPADWQPEIAMITNVKEDHLDRYGSMATYRKLKATVAAGQSSDGWVLLPAWDRKLALLLAETPARKMYVYDHEKPLVVGDLPRDALVHVDGQGISIEARERVPLFGTAEFPLSGRDNLLNLAFAAGAAFIAGRRPDEMAIELRTMRPVEHRLEPVRTWNGVQYINDSAASAPVAVASALEALKPGNVVLICGGVNKGLDFGPMIRAIQERRATVVLLPGSGSDDLAACLPSEVPVARVTTMAEAVRIATTFAASGHPSYVLLSPGCSSYESYLNEFERGRAFIQAVNQLAVGTATGPTRVGLIDSGLGVLPTAVSLLRMRGSVSLILSMDPDAMPWGPLDEHHVATRALMCAEAAVEAGAMSIVLACNTASVLALEMLREVFEPAVPVIGTVPAIKSAAALGLPFAVWATEGTTRSPYQEGLIREFAPGIEVTQVACPGLAEAIEAGDLTDIAAAVNQAVARTPATAKAVVLGCTQFPLAASVIRSSLPPGCRLYDSADAVARQALKRIGPPADAVEPMSIQVIQSGRRATGLPQAALLYESGRLLQRYARQPEPS